MGQIGPSCAEILVQLIPLSPLLLHSSLDNVVI